MNEVPKVCQGCFNRVSGSFKEVSRKFQEFVSRVFQESFWDLSMKIEGCFDGVLSGFQEDLKEVEWMFEGSLQGVSRKFYGCFKED